MKKSRAKNKLTLNPETIRHMKHLAVQDLRQVQGGDSRTCSGQANCTSTIADGGH